MSNNTPNLGISHILASQTQKEVTASTAFDEFDGAITALLTKAFPSDADYTLTTTEGGEAYGNIAYKFTGTITATRNIIVPAKPKLYVVSNATTGGQSIVVKTASGTGITIASTTYALVYCDGTNVVGVLGGAPVTDATLSMSDITTNNVSITKHGFAPKAPNIGTQYLDGTGNYSTPVGTGVQIGGVLTKVADYTLVTNDSGKIVQLVSGTHTFTLPSSPPTTTWFTLIKNVGTGTLTVHPPYPLTIDAASSDLTLHQGDAVMVFTDGSNYFTASARPVSLGVVMPGVGTNSQILVYNKMDRATIFPASAPNSFAVAKTAATGSTTYTFKKNGTSFATVLFSASGTTGAFTQASDAVFAAGDILEIDGPATADATLANMGITLQGYRF